MNLLGTIQKNRKRATLSLIVVVLALGGSYQYAYHKRRDHNEQVIRGYYRQYLHREADATGLRHWVTWSLNKWSLEKVRQIGFEEAARKGAR